MYVVGFKVVPVIVPEQLSVVVGAVAVTEHSPFKPVRTGVTGGVTSFTTTLKAQVAIFPLVSATV